MFSETAKAIGRVYDAVTSVKDNFDALGRLMTGIKNAVIQPFINAWTSLKLGVKGVQLAWEESVFGSGDTETIKKLKGEIVVLTKELADGTLQLEYNQAVVDNFGEAVDEVINIGKIVGEEFAKIDANAAMQQAQNNVRLRQEAEVAMVENEKILKRYMLEAELLRQQRDDVRLSFKERIKANQDLEKVLKKQEKVMVENGKKDYRLPK